MANSKHNPFDFPHQGRTRDVLDFLAAIVTGILIWAIFVAAGLVIFIAIAGAQSRKEGTNSNQMESAPSRSVAGIAVQYDASLCTALLHKHTQGRH